jgi:hypothetical protein
VTATRTANCRAPRSPESAARAQDGPASLRAIAERPRVPTEKEVQHAVRRLLDVHGVAVYDTSQPFRAAITAGVPDMRYFCERRGFVVVEVKRPGGKQSPEQGVFAERCANAGVPYVLGGVDAVAAFLALAGRAR